MARSWARCMSDQMVNLDPDGRFVLTIFGVKRLDRVSDHDT